MTAAEARSKEVMAVESSEETATAVGVMGEGDSAPVAAVSVVADLVKVVAEEMALGVAAVAAAAEEGRLTNRGTSYRSCNTQSSSQSHRGRATVRW